VTGIVMATYLEAAPFVRGLGLRRSGKKPFRVYDGEHYRLILSGIGKANAAMATAVLALDGDVDTVINAGAAGALRDGFAVGDIRVIDRVVEGDRPRLRDGGPRIVTPDPVEGHAGATLITHDRPILEPADRARAAAVADLADMEGAAVVQACRTFGLRCHLVKIVTDTPEHSTSVHIIFNIRRTRRGLYEYCRTAFFAPGIIT